MARWRGAGSPAAAPGMTPPPLLELQLANGAFQPAQPRLGCLYRPARRRPRRESSLAAGMREAELPQGSPRGGDRGAPPHQTLRRFAATDDVSFAVRRGEIFGLLGPNGAGKSTTFKMECGLLRPSEGQALVTGIDLAHSPSAARQRPRLHGAEVLLYKQLTVAQNLSFFAGIYGLFGRHQQTRIDAMVTFAPPLARSKAESLPLGLRQRLSLACALLHEPPLLFSTSPPPGRSGDPARVLVAHQRAGRPRRHRAGHHPLYG